MTTDIIRTKEFHMNMEQPPAYSSKDKSRWYIVAATVIVVTILVGFFGVFYLLLSAPSSSTVVNTISNEGSDSGTKVVELGKSFEMADGKEHFERMSADGETITVKNIGDKYIVVLDHTRNILVARNLSTTQCFFAQLEELGDMDMEDMDNMKAIYYEEILPGGDPFPADPRYDPYNFLQIPKPIASGYVNLTNSDVVDELCGGGKSFWVQPMEVPTSTPMTRVRRARDDIIIIIIIWRCDPVPPEDMIFLA